MSKSTTTETKQTNTPPAWAQPLLEQSASEAQKLYDSKTGFNVYQGPRVADQSAQTQAGQNLLTAAAGGMTGTAANAVDAQGKLQDAYSALNDTASGKYLTDGNPYYRKLLDQNIADASAKIQSQFSGAGRYGSGANTRALGTTTGNMLLQGLNENYNTERANQLNAIGQQANIANSIIGSGAQVNNLLTAPGQTLAGVGQAKDAYNQALVNADIAKFNETDKQDWTRLGALQAAAQGAAGPYGQSTGTQTTNQPFNFLGAAGLLGSLFTGPGGSGALYGKSDERLKEDVRPEGKANGHNVYSWRYLGDNRRWRGVMAQEVMRSRPDAVVMEADGFYAVNYAALGLAMEAA